MKIKTPEEILEKLTGESIDTLRKNYVSIDVILQAMKAYANQLELSDEEIEKWAEDAYGCSGTQAIQSKREVNIALRGAHWYKSEQKRRRNENL